MTSKRHVLVSGAAGGIGDAVCDRLHRAGLHVTGIDRRVREEASWRQLQVDFAQPGAAFAAASDLTRRVPVTDVVHCAATQTLGAVGEVPVEEWERTFRVNVLAVEELVSAVAADLRRARGSVVVVTSVHASATTRGMAPYATTKAALRGWVTAAALDLAPEVRVNAVQPGAVDTPMLQAGFVRDAERSVAILAAATPLQFVARPADIAEVVATLLDPSFSRFITGASLVVDGGALSQLATE